MIKVKEKNTDSAPAVVLKYFDENKDINQFIHKAPSNSFDVSTLRFKSSPEKNHVFSLKFRNIELVINQDETCIYNEEEGKQKISNFFTCLFESYPNLMKLSFHTLTSKTKYSYTIFIPALLTLKFKNCLDGRFRIEDQSKFNFYASKFKGSLNIIRNNHSKYTFKDTSDDAKIEFTSCENIKINNSQIKDINFTVVNKIESNNSNFKKLRISNGKQIMLNRMSSSYLESLDIDQIKKNETIELTNVINLIKINIDILEGYLNVRGFNKEIFWAKIKYNNILPGQNIQSVKTDNMCLKCASKDKEKSHDKDATFNIYLKVKQDINY